ncbi:hypothetical protein AOC29_11035 [Polynucleobacter sp. JS-JIR-5-A7]|nr:hypothetical protein AOC29_11035 [Polynucleobacter sp. JS-JIR-5-A7]
MPPPLVPAPDPSVPKGQQRFDFRRSGYLVLVVMILSWIPGKTVFAKEFRDTSMIASLRKA